MAVATLCLIDAPQMENDQPIGKHTERVLEEKQTAPIATKEQISELNLAIAKLYEANEEIKKLLPNFTSRDSLGQVWKVWEESRALKEPITNLLRKTYQKEIVKLEEETKKFKGEPNFIVTGGSGRGQSVSIRFLEQNIDCLGSVADLERGKPVKPKKQTLM